MPFIKGCTDFHVERIDGIPAHSVLRRSRAAIPYSESSTPTTSWYLLVVLAAFLYAFFAAMGLNLVDALIWLEHHPIDRMKML